MNAALHKPLRYIRYIRDIPTCVTYVPYVTHEVNAALHWAPHQPREVPVDSFLADDRLLPVHEAARILTGERGKPKRILLDWLHWAGNAEGRAGSAWWISSAALENKVRGGTHAGPQPELSQLAVGGAPSLCID